MALSRSDLIDKMSTSTHEGATAVTASLFIAAADATDAEVARSDAQCTGTADDVLINDAFTALSSGGCVALSSGNFSIAAPVYVGSYHALRGANKGATTFTVNVSADPGASNLDFWWEAKVR